MSPNPFSIVEKNSYILFLNCTQTKRIHLISYKQVSPDVSLQTQENLQKKIKENKQPLNFYITQIFILLLSSPSHVFMNYPGVRQTSR